ncbi:MAG: nucleoside deaminase [Coriobacteriales bacterium]
MATERDIHYMGMALEQARQAAELGEVPIGAVVVYDPVDPATRRHVLAQPQVVGLAGNRRETAQDPSAHAEFSALMQASRTLGRWRLSGCTVYVTLEPCIMCAGLMHQARVDRCVFGTADERAGALGTLYSVHEDERLNHRFEVEAGVLGEECRALMQGFFQRLREQRRSANRKADKQAALMEQVGAAGGQPRRP